MFTLCNAGGFKPGCHATAAASASTTSARPLIAAWPTGASPYSPRHSVAAFQDQGPTPPAPLDLSWAQRVKTGDPATWHPSASSNLDADLDQDFLRSDDADLGWDTLAASIFLIEGWRCIMEGLRSQTWQMARKVAGEREA